MYRSIQFVYWMDYDGNAERDFRFAFLCTFQIVPTC